MNNLKCIPNIILAVVCWQCLWHPCCLAADGKDGHARLRGIEKAFIVIEYSKSGIDKGLLTEKQIRTDTWKKLRAVSISLLPSKKFRKGKMFSSTAVLNIKCKVFEMQEGVYGYEISLEVFRGVEIPQDTFKVPSEAIPVWSVKKFDIADKIADVNKEIGALVDAFVNVYRAVKPKMRTPF